MSKPYILTDEEKTLLEQLCKAIMPPGSKIFKPTATHVPALSEYSGGAAERLFYIDIKDPIIKELARRAIKAGIGGEYIGPRDILLSVNQNFTEEVKFVPSDESGPSYPAFYEMITNYNTLKEAGTFKKLAYNDDSIINGLWEYMNGKTGFFFTCFMIYQYGPNYMGPQAIDRETFALPSLPIMFSLLPLFAGKSEKIPRGIFTKPFSELTDGEKHKADKILDSLLGERKTTLGPDGKSTETQHYITTDNPKIQATGTFSFDLGLFKDDLAEREKELAIHIKRTFGPEGMRHFLGLIIGLEENYRRGYFYWTINEHLKRLGITKKKRGSYDKKARIIATGIIKIFTSLCLTAYSKKDKTEVIEALKLFSIDGYRAELFNKQIIDSSLLIRAADFWYKKAVTGTDKDSPKYTKLLKNIAKVNHWEHPLVLFLAPLFAIFWRMNPKRKLSVTSLMDWCDLDHKGKKRTYNLTRLEGQLDWMKKNGHLGDWHNSDENNKYPSKCKKPFECMLSFDPPDWFNSEMKSIRTGRDSYKALPPQPAQEITIETIELIKRKTKTSNKNLANHLGFTAQYIGLVLSGKRPITPKLSKAMREYIKDLDGG